MHFYSEVGRECLFCEATCEPGDPAPNSFPISPSPSVSECLAGESEGRGYVSVSGNEKNAKGDCSCQNLVDDGQLFGRISSEFETEKVAHHTQRDMKYGFVLRKLLEYPQAKCAEYFKRSEYEGTGWFSVCKSCSELVENGHSIHHRIEELKRQLDQLKKILKDKILSGPIAEHDGGEGRDEVGPGTIHLEVRKHIKIDNRKLSSNNVFDRPDIKFEIGGLEEVRDESNNGSDYLSGEAISSPSADYDDDEDKLGRKRIKDESYGTESGASPRVNRDLKRSLRPERPITRYDESSSDDGRTDNDNSVKTTGCREKKKSDLEYYFAETIDQEPESGTEEDCPPEPDNPLSSNQQDLKCGICCAVYTTKQRLREHEELHKRKTGVLKCKKCAFVCENHKALREHSHGIEMKAVLILEKLTVRNETLPNPLIKTATGTADLYNCDKCPYIYKTVGKLKAHKKLHSSDDVLKCELCGYVCEYERAMKVHVTKHHTSKLDPDKDELTRKKLRREREKREVSSDSEDAQEDSYNCDKCPYIYKTIGRLKAHKKLHSRDDVLKCELCGYVCAYERAMKVHATKHHPSNVNSDQGEPDNSYNCDKCPYIYKTVGKLKAHKKLHSRDDVLKCELCGYVCEYDSSMKVHVTKHHPSNLNSNKDEQAAAILNMEYETLEVTSEYREKAQGKSYNCNKCPYVYTTIGRLNEHKELHRREDVLKCQLCGYVCEYERAMKIHVTKHHPSNDVNSDNDEPARKKSHMELEKRSMRSGDKEKNQVDEQECPATTEISAKNQYKCNTCKAVYQTRARIEQHVKLHKDPSALKCPNCPFVCQSTRHLAVHGNKRHGEVASHENLQKRRMLQKKKSLERKASARNRGPFKCDHCPSAYTLRKGLGSHVRRYHPDKFLQCEYCEKCFPSKQLLQVHQYNSCKNIVSDEDDELVSSSGEKKKPIACEHCPASFKTSHKYDKHIQTHHSRDTFPCSECKASFPTANRLRYHKATQHADTHNVCTVCGYKANGSQHLRLHMQKHTKEKMAMCEICSKTFTTLVYLTAHKNKEHYKELGVEPLKCKDCNLICTTKAVLKYHIQKVHEKKFNFSCETCGKGFLFASSLSNHSVAHSTERSLICQYCGASYVRNSVLDGHMKSHHPKEYAISKGLDLSQIPLSNVSNDGPFKCKFCKEEFAFRWTLQNHLKSHTEIFKKFKCDICGNGYSSQAGLKRHEEAAHSGNIYTCICGKTFPCQDYLGYHIRNVCSKKKKT